MNELEQERERAKREERERLDREQLVADLTEVLSLSAGRRVLEHVVYDLGALQMLSFAVDPRQHAYNEGQRAVGVALNRELERAAVDRWAQMHFERLERIRLEPCDPNPNKTDH